MGSDLLWLLSSVLLVNVLSLINLQSDMKVFIQELYRPVNENGKYFL